MRAGQRDIGAVGQAGKRVFGREAGDVVGGLHGLLDGGFGEVRGAGIAPALAQIDGHAQRLVAVALHGLQLALAHADRQAAALGSLGARIRRPQLLGMLQSLVHQPLEKAWLKLKPPAARIGPVHWKCLYCWSEVFHSGGYDSRHCSALCAATDIAPYHVTQTHQRLFCSRKVRCRRQRAGPELKAELKGTYDSTKTDLKRESDALQDLGKELMTLRSDLFKRLQLSDQLIDALAEAKRITNFEGKRRQLQYVGKLMRKLTPEQVAAVKQALDEQRNGSASEKCRCRWPSNGATA